MVRSKLVTATEPVKPLAGSPTMVEKFVVITLLDYITRSPGTALSPPLPRKEAEIEASWMEHHKEYNDIASGGLHVISLARYNETRR